MTMIAYSSTLVHSASVWCGLFAQLQGTSSRSGRVAQVVIIIYSDVNGTVAGRLVRFESEVQPIGQFRYTPKTQCLLLNGHFEYRASACRLIGRFRYTPSA